VSRKIRSSLTVRQGLTNRQWTWGISGMSTAAITEFLDLWEATADEILREQQGRTVWRWTPDKYSAKSAYKMLHTGSISFRGHTFIWKTWAPLKVKIFLWLSFRRLHWTNDRRARHGLEAREECFLCNQAPETIDHILCSCPYAREVWFHVCRALGRPLPPTANSVLGWWKRLRGNWQGNRRKGMDSLFALTSWLIWKERNAQCFSEATTTVLDLLLIVKVEADQWAQAGANDMRSSALFGGVACYPPRSSVYSFV
jgi:hypothetical protein